MEKLKPSPHKIESLGLEIMVGQTIEVLLPPSQIPHIVPDTKRMRLMGKAGTQCFNSSASVVDTRSIRWTRHGDYGKPPYVICPACDRKWK